MQKKGGDVLNEVEVEHRLTELEQRTKSNTHRIDGLEPIVEEIHTMSKTMVQLVGEVRHTDETVASLDAKVTHIDERVDEIERAPSEDAKKNKATAITAVISTLSGMVVSGILSMILQYMK